MELIKYRGDILNKTYKIEDCPNWNLEAIGFIMEATTNRIDSIIENHNSFGKKKEEMVNFFQSYINYKNKLIDEVMPIYGKYQKMKMIFQMEEKLEKDDLYLGITLIQYMEQKYKGPLSKEKIDELVGEYILNEYILEGKGSLDEDLDTKPKIISLSGLVELLENVDLSNGEKMLLISLYQNRYEIIEEMQGFTEEVAPIFQGNFHIIEDEYRKTLEDLKKVGNFENLVEKIIPMKLVKTIVGSINLTTFPCNGLYMRYYGEDLWVNVGIYVFLLGNWKRERGFQGAELVASLKALGDETRLKIIGKVTQRPMYIQEIAEELDLTPATISHHINLLLRSQLINLIVEADKAKKIYYEVNKDKLKELGSVIESLGDENKGGLDFNGKATQISIS